MVKNLLAEQKMTVRSLGREDPLEEEMATHSSILTWRIPGKMVVSKSLMPKGVIGF